MIGVIRLWGCPKNHRVGIFITASFFLLLTSRPALAQDITQLSGTVSLNDGAAPSGQAITVESEEGDECGTTSTGEGGSYSLELNSACTRGETVQFFLGDTETGLLASEQIELEGGAQQVDISFATDGVVQQVDQVGEIEQTRAQSLIEHPYVFWLLFTVIVGAVLLLGVMVFAYSGLAGGQRESNYRRQVEGLVLLMVVVSISILGVTGKITPEGLTAVLGAITGYAIGQARSSLGQPPGTPSGDQLQGPSTAPLDAGSTMSPESAMTPDPPDEPDVPATTEIGPPREGGRAG